MLSSEPIGSLLAKLSIPAIVGMVVNALYNVVDTIFIGHGVGALAIGGLTIAFPIQILMMGFALTLGLGAASVVSRNLGSGNRERAYTAAGNTISSAIIVGLVITAVGLIFLTPLIYFFGATDTLFGYAKDYLSIILIGSVFITFAMATNNLARAEGNAKVAMFSMIIGTGMNIVLDPIFIFVLKMGIRGAAIATVISQFLSFLWMAIYFLSGKSSLTLAWRHLKIDFSVLWEMISLGIPALIRHLGASILALVLNNTLKIYGGDMYIAAVGVINRLLSFALMPLFGLAQGFQPIAGYNYGAKNRDRVVQSVKLSISAGSISSVFFFLIMMIIPGILMKMFTSELELIEIGTKALRYVVLAMPLLGIQVIGATYFQAVGKAGPALFLGMSRQILFLIPLTLILPRIFGLDGVFAAFPTADILASLVTFLWLVKDVRGLKTELMPDLGTIS